MTVPGRPAGVMVTGMVTDWPGSTTNGVTFAAGLRLVSHKSPVGELTDGSNAAVSAVMDTTACSLAGAWPPNGPPRNGVTIQSPSGTAAAAYVLIAVMPGWEMRSGSPNGQLRSK